jgi:Zn-dependent membrane protease YugP
MFFFGDTTFLIILPGLILALWAQSRVSGAYAKWSRYRSTSGVTGAQVATDLLRRNGVYDVSVQLGSGELTDHYDPKRKVIRLSRNVYGSSSVAALAIAAHETGHVIQHASGYAPLEIRNNLVPVANIGSAMAWPLFIIGLVIGATGLAWMGVLIFSAALLFHLVTLPVEYNASNRALAMLVNGGYISDRGEIAGAKDVLGAAALTYVAATAMAALQLLRMVALLGGFSRRD